MMTRGEVCINRGRISLATLMLLVIQALSCSIYDSTASDVTAFAVEGILSPPNLGTEEYAQLCLAPEALTPEQRARLDTKVPSNVLANAIRSSVLVTFNTLYPNTEESCLKTCSGTLIKVGNKTRVLTNQHCFSDNFIRSAKDNRCAYDNQQKADSFSNPCMNTFAHVNFPASDEQQTISLACQGSFAASKELDLAIFAVDANSLPANHPHADLWAGEEVATGQEAFLLHHPNCGQGNFQQIPNTSIGAMIKTITFESCRITALPAEAEKLFSLQQNIAHTCVTLPGSSGAAILDANTGAILAVHQAMLELTQTDDSDAPTTTKHHFGHGANLATVRTFIANAP